MNCPGAWIATRKIGCSSTGPAAFSASRVPCRPAMRNAMSELSTAWCSPSVSVTVTSTTGNPSGPRSIASRAPCSTAGM